MTLALLLAAAVILVVAGVAFVRALRGHTIDDHPHCRACGFDLRGKPESSSRCSECGADLARAGAVVVGLRGRNYPLILGAGGVLVLMGGLLVALGVIPDEDFDPNPYKPISWLTSDLTDGSSRVRWAAIAELRKRSMATSPPKADLLAAADRILAWQASPAKTWQREMGDFIELLQANGLLDPARFERYLKGATSFGVKLRIDLRRGDPIPIRISPVVRLGNGTRIASRHAVKFRFVSPSGRAVERELPRGAPLDLLVTSSVLSPSFLAHPETLHLEVPDGALIVEVQLMTELFDVTVPGRWIREGDLPLTTLMQTTTHPMQLLPAGANNIPATGGEELHAAIRKAVSEPTLEREYAPGGMSVNCSITFMTVPTDLAYDCVLLHGGKETVLGQFAVPKGGSTTLTVGKIFQKDSEPPKIATLILRPNPQAARRSVDLKTYADLELRWDNVRTTFPSPYVSMTAISPPTTAATTQPVP